MNAPLINDPKANELFAAMRRNRDEQLEHVKEATAALDRLVAVMRTRCGQAYKLRALLYSLYNGKAASLLDVVCLDWALRKDLATVILAFGYEDRRNGVSFYYDALQARVKHAGQWDWFIALEEDEV